MRLTIFLLLFAVIQVMGLESYSQETEISLNFRNTSLKDVLATIEDNTGFYFMYSSAVINVEKKINIEITDKSIEEVLNKVLEGSGINYDIKGRQILLTTTKDEYNNTFQQQTTVKGKVTDSSGIPLPGVTVLLEGSTNGTITNEDGEYILRDIPLKGSLQFSFIGMRTQSVQLSGKTVIDVTMEEESIGIEEVVAIGYGTQKRVNMTGSVSTVTVADMEKRSVSNTVFALQGKVPGLQIVQQTGVPGREGSSITLRGESSWGTGTTPLILIDGVVGDLDNVPSTDIESISVLKDAASASIYGARAANGVILVTTKKGRAGKPVFSVTSSVGVQTPTDTPSQIWNSVDYMTLFNKAVERGALSANPYPQSIIDLYSDPDRDKDAYPDYNWDDAMWNPALIQQYNFGVNGGTDAVKYNISTGYLNQDGVLRYHGYKKYTGLANISTKINEVFTVGTNINFSYDKSRSPYDYGSDYVFEYMTQTPMAKPYINDGSGHYTDKAIPTSVGGSQNNRNPFYMGDWTYRKNETWRANIQGFVDVNIIHKKDMSLVWSSKYATSFKYQFNNYYGYEQDTYYYLKESDYDEEGSDDYELSGGDMGGVCNAVKNYTYRTTLNTINSTLTWNWKLNEHEISALGGFSQEEQHYRWLGGQRSEFPVAEMYELDGMGSTSQSTTGGQTEWAYRSYFGRANYAFKGKYLLEANFRYDGTSKIYSSNRWGFFPSASVGWRISEENFMKESQQWIDNLKLRLSYGLLGNADIGNYAYQNTYSTTQYGFDDEVTQAVYQSSYKNKNLKWEKTYITNIGIDLNLNKNIFYTTIDMYNKYTSGILADASIPSSAGLSAPTVNYGEFKNYGIELSIGHSNKIRDFKYDIHGQISVNRNKVMKYPDTYKSSGHIIEEGHSYYDYYMYECTGIFKSQEEIDAIDMSTNPQLGDIKFKDQDNDGDIDSDDRIRIKGYTPDFIYSFGGDFNWRNFDMSFFFQGVHGIKYYLDGAGWVPFSQGSSPHPMFRNAYDPDTNPNSNVPAIWSGGYTPMNGDVARYSTYYLSDGSYLRLKNIQVGYNLPKILLSKLNISQIRCYVSGDNLLTFTNYFDNDPERASSGGIHKYPNLKTLSVGLDIKF